GTPIALLHNLKLNGVVHEQNLFLTVRVEEIPHVPPGERLEIRPLGSGFHRLIAHFGFMEDPDIPALLEKVSEHGLDLRPPRTTFVLSRNLVAPAPRSSLARWRRRLFIVLARNAVTAEEFFRLPSNRVVELGMKVEV
ncbi:MAG: potassium transport system protein kup, partial [Acidobacteria bacterium]|nr:potassium transport system protein kup [Acidobacteriota bacterium]